MTLFTVGYEGRSADEGVAALRQAGVTLLIDVRELPLSRKKGLSKTALSERLAGAGIRYRHVRSAGNPYREQRADVARCLALYEDHLRRKPDVVDELIEMARDGRAALLCFEKDPCSCHRSILARHMRERAPAISVTDV